MKKKKQFDEIIYEEEFLPEELEEIRSYVKEHRKEDIVRVLYIYDQRDLLPKYLEDIDEYLIEKKQKGENTQKEINEKNETEDKEINKFGWEIIKEYEETGSSLSEDQVRFFYLRGFLECQLWLQGGKKEQKIYPVPEVKDLSMEEKDQYLHEEPLQFSLDSMKKYWEKFQNKHPDKRPKTLHLFEWVRSSEGKKPDILNVYARPYLVESYFVEGKGKNVVASRTFSFHQGEMRAITCRTDNNSSHAGIINYISWQDYLHSKKEGRPSVNPADELITRAERDDRPIPKDVDDIFRKMVRDELLLSDLSAEERQRIKQAEKEMPWIKSLKRYIQLSLIQLKEKQEYRKGLEAFASRKAMLEKFSGEMKKLWDKLFSFLGEDTVWQLQFAQDEQDRIPEEYELAAAVTKGYREDEYVVLLEDSEDNSERVKKSVEAITKILEGGTSPMAYQGHVLVPDENGRWKLYEEIDELGLPIKIMDKEKRCDKFVLVLDKENRLEESSEIIMDILNENEPEEEISKTAIFIIVEL
jgi:hypothetical protein